VPAGPSYSLIYPPYLTKAQIEQLRKEPPKVRQAMAEKLSKQFKRLPTLPSYPRPLLDKLNSYRTGCADAAGDCNAVNVVTNLLTGYGNEPSSASSWLLALADVPGVSVRHVTDAAGHRDIEFAFPFHDGVTGILVNVGVLVPDSFQYEGYVRDGQQTLVMKQALVSGPGVRP
jgi:hypothetical protein